MATCPICHGDRLCRNDYHSLVNSLNILDRNNQCPACGRPSASPGNCSRCGGRGYVDDDGRTNGRIYDGHTHHEVAQVKSTGGGNGSSIGDGVAGAGLGIFFMVTAAPLYAMFLVGQGIIYAVERRSAVPLFRGISRGAAVIGVFCALWGVLWALMLWIATTPHLSAEALAWNELFWGIVFASVVTFFISSWLSRRLTQGISSEQINPGPQKLTTQGKIAGWVAGYVSAQVFGTVVYFIWRVLLSSQPPDIGPVWGSMIFFSTIFGAILTGRAVARYVSKKGAV